MFGILGTDAAFANAAGRGGRKTKNVLSFIAGDQDMQIYQLSCTGDITIKTTKNGSEYIDTHADLEDATIMLQCDADTQVSIIGDVTKIGFYNWDDETEQPVNITELNVSKCKTLTYLDVAWCQNLTSIDLSKNIALTELSCATCSALAALDVSKNTALTSLECGGCTGLTALDVSKNTALVQLNCATCSALTALDLSKNTALMQLTCGYCTGLTTLDLSKNTALTGLSCAHCYALTALDLSKNTALTSLACGNCTGLTMISYPATNQSVSNRIANAITNADASDGMVYTDSDGAYYSAIADAATAKGWTIEQIPA